MNWLSFGATEQWIWLLRCACLVFCLLPYLMPEAPFCGYVLVGLRMRKSLPFFFASVRKSLVCLARLTREALTPFHSRGMSNETLPRPLSPVLNSVWPSLISEEVQLFGRLPVRSDVQQRHMQSGWGLSWVEMRSNMDLILKNLGAVWSLALIKILNLSRCVEWPFGVSEISE